MSKKWKPSRFNAWRFAEDGTLVVYNSYTGSIVGAPPECAEDILKVLRSSTISSEPLDDLAAELAEGGYLVPQSTDEFEALDDLYKQRMQGGRHLHLILLPTEDCNFRCTYCYEFFKRGKMRQDVQDSIVTWLDANSSRYDSVHIEWFGGEPLFADDVVLSLGQRLKSIALKHGLSHVSSMTTNGYYLDVDMMERLLQIDCATFTITIDGLEVSHDSKRILNGGGKTFSTIMENIFALRETKLDFNIRIRSNFDPHSLQSADDFVSYIINNFGGDSRFGDVNIRPISKWNGPNDSLYEICDAKQGETARKQILEKAMTGGFYERSLKYYCQPTGAVCYASKPNSFVIGADGKIMKCTLELDTQERNIVGQVLPDGVFDIDYNKMALWIMSGSDDAHCRSCYFAPSCQGAACAKERFDLGVRPCPKAKQNLTETLRTIYNGEMMTVSI